jgi:hypothetical protein
LFGFKFNINIYLKYGFVGRRDLNKGLKGGNEEEDG